MFVQLLILSAIALVFLPTAPIRSAEKPTQIDGVYKLVSETTTLSKPKAAVTHRKPPEWSGLYFFTGGHFSVTLMEATRNTDWFSTFPQTTNELGYESFAGTYEYDGKTLTLTPDLRLHPFYDRLTRRFEARFEHDKMILTERIQPYIEDMRGGTRVIVLARTVNPTK